MTAIEAGSLPIALIVAAADNNVIGRNNALPWDLPADLAHFKRLTMGKPILMGRKTFESIGRPLPGRTNIVISRDTAYASEGVMVVHSLDEALARAEDIALIEGANELMVIGGAEIYRLALPMASRLYITRVHAQVDGDAWLPEIDWADWQESSSDTYPADGSRPAHTFFAYTRR